MARAILIQLALVLAGFVAVLSFGCSVQKHTFGGEPITWGGK